MTGDRYSHVSTPAARGRWHAPVAGGPLRATVTVPGSKSLTNRELILAALADGPSRLVGAAALRGLGQDDRRAAHARSRHRADARARQVRRRSRRHAGVAAAGLHRGRLRAGRHGHAIRRGSCGFRARRCHPHCARERPAPADGHDDQGPARRRRRHRRRRSLGAAVHRARSRARARRRGRRRCERVEPVRLGPAAGGAALRRRTAPHPSRRAAAEHAAHRHDDRVARPPRRPCRAARSRRVGRPGRVGAREGRRDRARPLQRRAVPGGGDDRRRLGLGAPAGLRTRRSRARCSPRSSP